MIPSLTGRLLPLAPRRRFVPIAQIHRPTPGDGDPDASGATARREAQQPVARNVTKLVNVPRMAESEIHPLTRDEARILLDVASGERLYALYALALATSRTAATPAKSV